MKSAAARQFNDAVRRHPAAAREQWLRLREAFSDRGITFDGEPMATFLRPQFVDRQTWATLTSAATQLVALAERVARTAFKGRLEELLDFLGAPERHRPLLRLLPSGPEVSLSRVDGFIGLGGVRLIEINSDAPAGFGYADRMTEVFSEMPLLQEMRRSIPIEAVGSVDALVAELRGHARVAKPRVAIVDMRSVRTLPDQEILREEFERRGLDAVLIDPRDMVVADGRLVANGQPVDLVYRRTVISEVLGIERDAPAFFEAYAKGLAVFVNSFRCYLSEDKAFLALLTDESFRGLLSPGERAFVAAHVPWTRKVEERATKWKGEKVDLIPWMEAYRSELVLKPSHGYGGDSVTVGSAVDELQWSGAIQTALSRGGWIVQERVEIPEEEFPVFDPDGNLRFESLKVNTNPFYVGGARVGAVSRVSRDSVINVSAGGGSVPTFVVDADHFLEL
jgi:uncharacterized circularly permuted ATP-grasp superfamily protein